MREGEGVSNLGSLDLWMQDGNRMRVTKKSAKKATLNTFKATLGGAFRWS